MPEPIYTPANCSGAYQLRWSLAIFPRVPLPPVEAWLEPLRVAVEKDDLRILEQSLRSPSTHQFLISSQPHVAPHAIIRSLKGRLQNLIQADCPKAFRRNYWLTTVGDVSQETVEAYVADQLGHHIMADPHVQDRLRQFQLEFPHVDLSEPQASAHGRYVYNLHLVLVHQDHWCATRDDWLARTRDQVLAAARKKSHRLSRLSLLADHLHLTLGCGIDESPAAVAFGYLNNLAYAHGMQAVYRFGYYVGSFGNYDMGAIWRYTDGQRLL